MPSYNHFRTYANGKGWIVNSTFGWVKLKEFGYIPTNAKVISGTISQKARRFYVSVLCEVHPKEKNIEVNSHDGIGIDVGIKVFAICSNGETFGNINYSKHVKKLEKSLKRQQRSYAVNMKQRKENVGRKEVNSAIKTFKNKL